MKLISLDSVVSHICFQEQIKIVISSICYTLENQFSWEGTTDNVGIENGKIEKQFLGTTENVVMENARKQIIQIQGWDILESKMGQEAQLSQRDRATLCVIEYFAKSLKIIQNDTVAYGVCKSLLVVQ